MKIVYFGSADIGLPSLEAIKASGHDLVHIFTQPAHRAGRGRHPKPTDVRLWAEENSVPCVEAEKINAPEMIEQVKACGADLLVVIAFGQKIGDEIINFHAKGAINVHTSLLPEYRGAAPINWAVVNGDKQTGVSIITLVDRMDAGPVWGQDAIVIEPGDTAVEVHDKLAKVAPGTLMRVINQIGDGSAVCQEQDESLVTKAPKMKKSDGYIDWSQPASTICDRIRGFWPWPGGQSDYVSAETGKCVRVTFANVEAVECESGDGRFGMLNDELNIICGEGAIKVLTCKPAGKGVMEFKSFVNGRRVKAGDVFLVIEKVI
jgi:methionyl-tRNA formyltransferase